MSDINLDETLRALRESVATEGPSASLESKLVGEFRRHHRQKGRRRIWIGLGIGVAASLFIALALRTDHPPVAVKAPPTLPVLIPEKSIPLPAQPVTVATTRKPHPRVVRKTPVPPEAGTDFIPIPYAPDFRAEDSAAIVRVKLPRYSLQTVGLPFNPELANERIDADVLMGQDGIARAIRFVH